MQQLRVAVIGCGAIVPMHIDAIRESEGVELVACADIERERAEKTAEQSGARCYTDWHAMLREQNPDVVHICTPHYLHADMAIEAMKFGSNVFCEKPMAITVQDALRMEQCARETGKLLGICFQNRFKETSQKAMALIKSGRVGEVLGAKGTVTWLRGKDYYNSGEWRGRWDTEGGGVLINQAIHTLDLLDWLTGGVSAVDARTALFGNADCIEVEDAAMALFQLKNGGSALFFATNCYVGNSPVELEIICSGAKLLLNDNLTVTYSDGTVERYTETAAEQAGLRGKVCWGAYHTIAADEFYRAVREGRRFPIDGSEGIRTIRIIQAIYQSAGTGRRVALD